MAKELVKYPMFKTYMSKGLSEDEIKTDATITIINRGLNMTEGERAALGLSSDFFTAENILGLMDNKRIRFDYDPASIGDPTYRISMDLDGDGIFMTLNNPNDPESGFKPEANRELNSSLTLSGVRSDFQNQAWQNWKSQNIKADAFFKTYGFLNIEEQPLVMQTLKGMFNLVYNGYNKGKNGIEDLGRMFNDIEWLPDINIDMNTVERQLQENQIAFLTYQQQKKAGVFDDNLATQFEGKEQTAMGYQNTATNLLMDTISRQEGGFYAQAYDSGFTGDRNKRFNVGTRGGGGGPVEMAAEGSKIQKAEYDLMMSENGDPTIGTGLSLKDATVKKELTELGYDIDKLLTGEQTITREDNNIVMMKILDDKLKLVENLTGIKDLQSNKNAYLAVALVKLAYNSSTWIGPRFREALNNFIETGDMKYIGNFGSYKEGTDEFYSGATAAEVKQYEPALLNELWNDAEGQAAIGYGGFRTMMRDVAEFITAWSQGQMTYFPDLQVTTSPQIKKKSKSVLD